MIKNISKYALFIGVLLSCNTQKENHSTAFKKQIIGTWKYAADTSLKINFTENNIYYSKNNILQKENRLNVDSLLYEVSCKTCFPATFYKREIDSFTSNNPTYVRFYIKAKDKTDIKSKCFAFVYLDKDSLELYDLDHGVYYRYNK